MQTPILMLMILVLTLLAYFYGRKRSIAVVDGQIKELHSLPSYYGYYTALWCALPALVVFGIWTAFESTIITKLIIADLPPAMRELSESRLSLVINDIKNAVNSDPLSRDVNSDIASAVTRYSRLQAIGDSSLTLLILVLIVSGGTYARQVISKTHRARNKVESIVKVVLMLCSTLAIFTTLGIILSVLFEAIRFFNVVPVSEFLFGLEWSPQMSIRSDQVGSSGSFGAVPLFTGTLLISFIAMLVAVPIGLMSAIYLSEYASSKVRDIAKPMLEILAGIPTVVYGFFAALTVAPIIRDSGGALGLEVSSESALAAGLVMGIMIVPFISSLSDDVITAVPQAMRDGSYGLGATQAETIKSVLIPAALPGIVGGILLAASRAIGETMIVVMAAGLSANFTANPLESVTTVTVQIVTLLVGDQEFDSPKTLAAFALALVLFFVTLLLNVIALHVVKTYREQYE